MNRKNLFKAINKLGVQLAKLLIRGYQIAISPLLGNRCRFYPSCSSYCLEAMESHGFAKGGYLSLKRLLKCHPWHPGGIDPVPSVPQNSDCKKCTSGNNNHQHSGNTT